MKLSLLAIAIVFGAAVAAGGQQRTQGSNNSGSSHPSNSGSNSHPSNGGSSYRPSNSGGSTYRPSGNTYRYTPSHTSNGSTSTTRNSDSYRSTTSQSGAHDYFRFGGRNFNRGSDDNSSAGRNLFNPYQGQGQGRGSQNQNQNQSSQGSRVNNNWQSSRGSSGAHLSTSTHSHYATNHNVNSGYHPQGGVTVNNRGQGDPRWTGRAGGGEPPHRIMRIDGIRRHEWRDGYHGYRRDWRDSNFFFSFYLFDPFVSPCVLSPWYYYPCLPPYLAFSHVVVIDDFCPWGGGTYYEFRPYDNPSSYGNGAINSAIDELGAVFNNADEGALDQLISAGSQVAIYNDGKYMYSIGGGDFHQMMLDNVHGVENVSFSVSGVRTSGSDVIVNARHEFTDPDSSESDVVYQEYRLRMEDGRYVIIDFNTSKSPLGARTYF